MNRIVDLGNILKTIIPKHLDKTIYIYPVRALTTPGRLKIYCKCRVLLITSARTLFFSLRCDVVGSTSVHIKPSSPSPPALIWHCASTDGRNMSSRSGSPVRIIANTRKNLLKTLPLCEMLITGHTILRRAPTVTWKG